MTTTSTPIDITRSVEFTLVFSDPAIGILVDGQLTIVHSLSEPSLARLSIYVVEIFRVMSSTASGYV